jgi:hypothetical protein
MEIVAGYLLLMGSAAVGLNAAFPTHPTPQPERIQVRYSQNHGEWVQEARVVRERFAAMDPSLFCYVYEKLFDFIRLHKQSLGLTKEADGSSPDFYPTEQVIDYLGLRELQREKGAQPRTLDQNTTPQIRQLALDKLLALRIATMTGHSQQIPENALQDIQALKTQVAQYLTPDALNQINNELFEATRVLSSITPRNQTLPANQNAQTLLTGPTSAMDRKSLLAYCLRRKLAKRDNTVTLDETLRNNLDRVLDNVANQTAGWNDQELETIIRTSSTLAFATDPHNPRLSEQHFNQAILLRMERLRAANR